MKPDRSQPPKKGMVSPHREADILQEDTDGVASEPDQQVTSSEVREENKHAAENPVTQPPSDSSKKVEKRR